MTRCEMTRCRSEAVLTWLGHPICEDHWSKHCDDKIDLYKEFGIAKPKMTPELRAEVEKTEKIRKLVDEKVAENLTKSKQFDEQRKKNPVLVRVKTEKGIRLEQVKEGLAKKMNAKEMCKTYGINPGYIQRLIEKARGK